MHTKSWIAAALAALLLAASAGAEARVYVGVGVGAPYYYGPYYGSYYYPYYPYYAYPPAVVYATPPPTPVVRTAPQQTSDAVPYWYYCASSKAYYPYVRECPEGWRQVPAQPAERHERRAAQPSGGGAAQGEALYSLGDAMFIGGKAQLRGSAFKLLDKVVADIDRHPDHDVRVRGYAAAGSGDLALRRADAVKRYLAAQGVDESRIHASSETALRAGGEAPAGHVDIVID